MKGDAGGVKTPKMKNGTPKMNTPKNKTPGSKYQDTPRPLPKPESPQKNQTPGKKHQKTPGKQQKTPAQVQQKTPAKQQQQQQQKTPGKQQKTPAQGTPKQPKNFQPAGKKQQQQPQQKNQKPFVPPVDQQNRTVRLTFPGGELKSVEQVRRLLPTAVSIKFPNVVFVEFATEEETDVMHGKLLAQVPAGVFSQVNFLGQKERQYQSSNRGLDNTRLFVRGIGNASEGDIRKLFPTASEIIIRGGMDRRGKGHPHRYCFIVYSSPEVCKEALDKSKGLTLSGTALIVNYAFASKKPAETEAQKRPAETAPDPAAKKAKTDQQAATPAAKVAAMEEDDDDEDDDDDDDDEEGEEEEDEDDEEEGDDDDEGGDEEDDDDDDDDDEDDDDEEDDEDDDDDDEE